MLTNRRNALKICAASIATACLSRIAAWAQTPSAAVPITGPFTLPPLPYAYEALEPYIDAETMHLHHDKHHAAYVNKLNEAVTKEPSLAATTNVDDLLKNLASVPESVRTSVRNNGGGHSNHSLFWQLLTPKAGGKPSGELAQAITGLGGLDKFQADFNKAGLGQFGSGWVWLVLDSSKKVAITTSPNQDSPLSSGQFPVFGIDVWEHAYYLKYHNVRVDYLKAVWNVLNWDFISSRYTTALKA